MNKLFIANCNICGGDSFRKVGKGYDYEYLTSKDDFQFVQCVNCGHLFLQNPPAVCELSAIYPENYLPYNFEEKLSPVTKYARTLIQRLKIRSYNEFCPANASILDIGAGSGILIKMLRDYGAKGWKLTANDFDAARLRYLETYDIAVLPGNFEEIEIHGKYDVIIMNQVLEHVYEPEKRIGKCAEILNVGGTLIIETPNFDSADFRIFKSSYWGGYHIPRHFNIFSDATLRRCLESNGFTIKRIEYMLSPSFWIQSLHHYFYDKGRGLSGFFTVNNLLLAIFFSLIDLLLSLVYKTSNMRIIAVKVSA